MDLISSISLILSIGRKSEVEFKLRIEVVVKVIFEVWVKINYYYSCYLLSRLQATINIYSTSIWIVIAFENFVRGACGNHSSILKAKRC